MPRKRKRRPAKHRERTTAEYRAYIASPEWRRKRREALQFHGGRCRICRTTLNLEVHHRHYARLFCEEMGDLEVMCGACHRHHHGHPIPRDDLYHQFVDTIYRMEKR